MIINLHGFNSAGNNNAFAQLCAFFEPQLRVISPSYMVHDFSKGLAEILGVLDDDPLFSDAESPVFIGSSTGALYAETLAHKFGGRLVLINPVVNPEQLKPLIGPQKNYATGVEYEFTGQQWAEFQRYNIDLTLPRLIFIESGDEKLDHHLTRVHYEGHASFLETDGNSHRYTHWDDALPLIKTHYFPELN